MLTGPVDTRLGFGPPNHKNHEKKQLEWSNGAETFAIVSTIEFNNLVEYEIDPSTLSLLTRR